MTNEDIQDKLVPILTAGGPTHVIAALPPSQETTPDQIAFFNRPNSVPYVRHSPLPVAAQAPVGATAASTATRIVNEAVAAASNKAELNIPKEFTPDTQTVTLPGPLQFGWADEPAGFYLGVPSPTSFSSYVDVAVSDGGSGLEVAAEATPLSTSSAEIALWLVTTSFGSQSVQIVPDGTGWVPIDISTTGTIVYAKSADATLAATAPIASASWASILMLLGSSGATPTVLQSVGLGGGSIGGNTFTGAFASPMTAGSAIIVGIFSNDATVPATALGSASDTDGNAYSGIESATGSGIADPVQVLVQGAFNVPHTGSTNTVTVHVPAGTLLAGFVNLYEVTGITALPLIPRFIPISVSPPLPVNQGGTGTASPSLVAGTGVTITGSFPNQTINTTGGAAAGTTGDLQINNAGAFDVVGSQIVGATANVNSGSLNLTHIGLNVNNTNSGGITLRCQGANIDINTVSALNAIRIGVANDSQTIVGGAASPVAFYNGTPTTQQTVTGSRSSGAALTDLLTKLAAFGLIVDGSTP